MPEDNRFKMTGIFGKVKHVFSEPENHKRGAYHAHSVAKLEDPPPVNDRTRLTAFWNTKIQATVPCYDAFDPRLGADWVNTKEFLDNHPCSRRYNTNATEKESLVELTDVVIACQFHRVCTEYCLRKTDKKKKRECRFKAPWPITDAAEIKVSRTEKSSSFDNEDDVCDDLNFELEFLPRRNHPLISNYNPWTSLLWRGNNDVQVIFSYYAAVKYITKYITKGDYDSKALHGILAKAIENEKNTLRPDLLKKFLKLINSLHNEREISIHESLSHTLNINMRYSTMNVKELYVTGDKQTYELSKKKSPSQESNTLLHASVCWIDYPNRDEGLNDISLYEMAKRYKKIKESSWSKLKRSSDDSFFPFMDTHPQASEGYGLVTNTTDTVINILPYNAFSDTSQKWQKQMILSFLPWRYNPESHTLRFFVKQHAGNTNWIEFLANNDSISLSTLDWVNDMFDVLVNEKLDLFENYVEQIQHLKVTSKKVRKWASREQTYDESSTSMADTLDAEFSEDEDSESNEFDLMNPDHLDQLYDNIVHVPDKQKDAVEECVNLATQYGLFDTEMEDDDAYKYMGIQEFSDEEVHILKNWIPHNLNTPEPVNEDQLILVPEYLHLIQTTPEQYRAFLIFKEYVDDLVDHLENGADKPEPLHMLVSGPAGTGKSAVLNACREYLKSKSLDKYLLVTAYTGMAATNVQGELMVSRLGLTTEKHRSRRNATQGNFKLSDETLKKLKHRNGHLLFLFLDEFGNIAAQHVYEMSSGFKQIQGGPYPFGKCCTIWFGDPHQLPPVLATSVMTSTLSTKHTGSIIGQNIFKTAISKVVLLKTPHRQQNDPVFHDILERIRNGTVNMMDWQRLSHRTVGSSLVPNLKPYRKALLLFGLNAFVTRFNVLKQEHNVKMNLQNLSKMNLDRETPLIEQEFALQTIGAIDSMASANKTLSNKYKEELSKKDAQSTGGLDAILRLAIGDLVTLRTNLLPNVGLVTNARGMIVGFGRNATTQYIEIVFVRVQDLRNTEITYGQGQFGDKVVPITRTDVTFSYRGSLICRKMFPLKLAYACTIHSVQAMTYSGPILFDPKSSVLGKVFYTGITRPRFLNQVVFLRPFTLKDISKKPSKDLIAFDAWMQQMNQCTLDAVDYVE